MTLRFLFTFLALFSAGCSTNRETDPLQKVDKWLILLSYNFDKHPVSPSQLQCFDMAIFDIDDHPPLAWLSPKAIPIAYVSAGEAEVYRDYWPRVMDEPWIMEANPNWPKSRYVDVRAPEWHALLLEEIIPAAVEQGFQGVMLDTIDTVGRLMHRHPSKAEEYREAIIELVAAIHDTFPDLLLLVNNGFVVLNEIAPYLDGIVVEDISWMPNFEKGGYMRVPEEWSSAKVATLQPIMEAYQLPIFAIDYVSGDNRRAIREAADHSRRLGFRPYVAEKELNQIYSFRDQACD